MVSEHCTRRVVTGTRDESLPLVAQRMRDCHVGTVVIVDDPDHRTPIGVLTDRDIVVGPVAQAADRVATLSAGEVMTSPVITVRDTDRLEDAVTRMQHHGVRRVPVVDAAGVLCGVLAVDDVLGHATAELARLVELMAVEDEREHVRRP